MNVIKECHQCVYYPKCDEYPFDESGCNDFKDRSLFTEHTHGYWKGAGLGDYRCSECWDTVSGGNRFKYCPNCGAKMEVINQDDI